MIPHQQSQASRQGRSSSLARHHKPVQIDTEALEAPPATFQGSWIAMLRCQSALHRHPNRIALHNPAGHIVYPGKPLPGENIPTGRI